MGPPLEPAGSRTAVALTFRQRGTAVVLTDSATGTSWIANDGYRKVDNWDDVGPPESRTDDLATVDDPTQREDLPRLPPDCTAVPIGVPYAVKDEFGVRAGRASVLRVLDNDPSVDCTSVVIDERHAAAARCRVGRDRGRRQRDPGDRAGNVRRHPATDRVHGG